MRWLLPFALLFVWLPVCAQNPTVTANDGATHCGSCTTQGGTTLYLNGNANIAAGSQFILWVVCTGVSSSTLSVSDTISSGGSQTWTATPLASTYTGATATGVVSMWIVTSATAVTGAPTDYATVGSTATCSDMNVFFQGWTNVGAQDVGPSGVSGLTGGSVTPTVANELVLGLLAGGNGGAVPVHGTGYAILSGSDAGGSNPGWEYKVPTTCGAEQAVWASGPGTVYTITITFKGTTPGASCTSVTNPPHAGIF